MSRIRNRQFVHLDGGAAAGPRLSRAILQLMCLLVSVHCLASIAHAQTPQLLPELDRSRIFEGESVRYQVFMNQFGRDAVPTLADFDDFDVQLLGSQYSSFSSNINGRRTSRQGPVVVYQLTPRRSGTLEVPAPSAEQDGKQYFGTALMLEVQPAPQQDIVILEPAVSRDTVYPMQPFTVSLTVAVKSLPGDAVTTDPLRVQSQLVALSIPWAGDAELPDGIEAKTSARRWLSGLLGDGTPGGFRVNGLPRPDPFEDMGGSLFGDVFGRRRRRTAGIHPKPTKARREGSDRDRAEYWHYKLERIFTANKIGELSFGPVTLKGVFGVRLDSREQLQGQEIYAFANAVRVMVQDVPTAGRPESYTGAVGNFIVGADLSPREAKVGDPLTLSVWYEGEGTLDETLAPSLATEPALQAFKVYDATEETRDSRRVFTYSIRPRDANLTEVPPIAMSYFDVDQEKFVTLQTAAIPISVSPADTMTGAEIAIATPARDATGGAIEASSEGIFANVTDLRQLRDETVRPGQWFVGMGSLAGLFVIVAFVAQRVQRVQQDVGLQRRRSAASTAKRRVKTALQSLQQGNARDGAEQLSAAFVGLVADVMNAVEDGFTRGDVAQQLRDADVDAPVVTRLTRLLDACDDARYGGSGDSLKKLSDEATSLLHELLSALNAKRLLS